MWGIYYDILAAALQQPNPSRLKYEYIKSYSMKLYKDFTKSVTSGYYLLSCKDSGTREYISFSNQAKVGPNEISMPWTHINTRVYFHAQLVPQTH